MTKLEAADILDPETTVEALRPYAYDRKRRFAVVEDACAIAAKVLRESGWISVKDRLPEDDDFVAVIVSGSPNGNITLKGAYEMASYSQDEGWILEMWPMWETPNVTHWMPLPELSEERRA